MTHASNQAPTASDSFVSLYFGAIEICAPRLLEPDEKHIRAYYYPDTYASRGAPNVSQAWIARTSENDNVYGILVTSYNQCQKGASCTRRKCRFYHAKLGAIMSNVPLRLPVQVGTVNNATRMDNRISESLVQSQAYLDAENAAHSAQLLAIQADMDAADKEAEREQELLDKQLALMERKAAQEERTRKIRAHRAALSQGSISSSIKGQNTPLLVSFRPSVSQVPPSSVPVLPDLEPTAPIKAEVVDEPAAKKQRLEPEVRAKERAAVRSEMAQLQARLRLLQENEVELMPSTEETVVNSPGDLSAASPSEQPSPVSPQGNQFESPASVASPILGTPAVSPSASSPEAPSPVYPPISGEEGEESKAPSDHENIVSCDEQHAGLTLLNGQQQSGYHSGGELSYQLSIYLQ